MTTREVAETLHCDVSAVRRNAKKCLPNKIIENGKSTFWTEKEVTVLLDFMKTNNNRTDLTCATVAQVAKTSLTPVLKVQQGLQQAQENATTIEQKMQIAQAGMKALADAMALLKAENEQLKTDLDESENYNSLLKYCDEHGLDTDRTRLACVARKIRVEMRKAGREKEIKKIPDSRYPNGINSYPVDFLDMYFSNGEF